MTRCTVVVGVASEAPSTSRAVNSVSTNSVTRSRRMSTSTAQAFMTAWASRSSIRASRRWSSVACSWLRSLAYSSARWRVFSRFWEKDGTIELLFFHGALQRVTVLTGEVYDLRDFGLSDFVRINSANTDTLVVDMKHNACGVFAALVEEFLKYENDEFHRRVIVIQQQYFVQARLLGLGAGLGDDAGAPITLVALFSFIIVRHAYPVSIDHPRAPRMRTLD